nr:copia protein [Tanacetum cinerariifolium]
MVTVRVILAVAASKQWELHQMKVHNVFLNGKDSNVAKSPFGLARGCVFQDPQQHRRLELEAAIKVVRFFKREPKTRIWTHGLNNGRTKWLKGILKNLGKDHPQPMLLYCDGHAALLISRNPRFHKRTTHIEVDCYYIRDEIVCENLDAGHVPTEEQVADFLHKALGKVQIDNLLRKFGV